MTRTEEYPPLVRAVVEGMRDNKARQVSVLDLRGVPGASSDWFVICHGTSTTQVDALADSVEDRAREDAGEKPLHREGTRVCEWVVLDYHDVVAHIFLEGRRHFYDLEGLWADAQRDDLPDDF